MVAHTEARRLRYNFIGTEMLLVGLIAEDQGVASKVIYACDTSCSYAALVLPRAAVS